MSPFSLSLSLMQIHEPEELREGLNVYFGREGLETVRSGENINKGRQGSSVVSFFPDSVVVYNFS